MDKTRKLRRELGYEVAKLHGLEESVDLTLDDASTRALALQIREQAGLCLDLVDQYQSSVPGRMWLDAERRCRPLRENLRRTEMLFRSNAGEWKGRTLTRSDIHRMCDWTWHDGNEPAADFGEADPGAEGTTGEWISHLAALHGSVEAHRSELYDELVAVVDDDELETDGGSAASLRFTLPMDEESPGHVLVVLVVDRTGLVYEHQYGGAAGRRIAVEGFLVPARARPEAKAVLEQFFLSDLGGDWDNDPDQAAALGRVRDAIREICYRGSGDRMAPLEIDQERLGELDEAWVPVVTPDGPGYLAWINAD